MQVETVFPSGRFGAGALWGHGEVTTTPELVCAWSLPLQKAVDLLTGCLGESKCFPISDMSQVGI